MFPPLCATGFAKQNPERVEGILISTPRWTGLIPHPRGQGVVITPDRVSKRTSTYPAPEVTGFSSSQRSLVA